jgi:uncharacterized Zn-binding protein involved in type VI secretion
MSQPIAKMNDRVVGLDTHIVLVSSPGGPVPTSMPFPFDGPIVQKVSTTVFIDNLGVALVGSIAQALPPHIPIGGPFQKPPSNMGTIDQGSPTIFINNIAVARAGDPVKCCNDPVDQVTGHVIVAGGKVFGG